MEPSHGSDVKSQNDVVAAAVDESSRQRSIVHILGGHYPSNVLQLRCNTCSLTYDSLSCFRVHFIESHGLEPELEHFTIQTISEPWAAVAQEEVTGDQQDLKAVDRNDALSPPPPLLSRETSNTSTLPENPLSPISVTNKRSSASDSDDQVRCRKVCFLEEPGIICSTMLTMLLMSEIVDLSVTSV